MDDKPRRIMKHKLFPSIKDNSIYDKILIDDESVSYISIPDDAAKITNIIKYHCIIKGYSPKTLTITDATAGVGGDCISFSNSFMLVNAIEQDAKRYEYLVNNINAYKIHNVLHYKDDCLNIIYNLSQQDVIFFDPPWGGKKYKNEQNIRLKLSDVYIEDICIKLFNENATVISPQIICLKLPKNYDLKMMYQVLTQSLDNISIYLYKLNKMFIVIISKIQ